MKKARHIVPGFWVCRGGGIRTHDLVVPNDARYRAALHPVKNSIAKVGIFIIYKGMIIKLFFGIITFDITFLAGNI